ncbi:helix-turn-helix domain-containing protein [Rugosimonospora africana]|uniref:Transcriptional regulator n=1 Tax=Rugosimonospora africana TaxID=556532 RepID=A0A8J3VU49_9ACTN|nr:helix-turn-helix transcriptional regulator [Rugosimonospora africana]GIH18371.1 transcriptional regulator [Rugosimonospora africana]
MAIGSPTVRRRRLGLILRSLRERQGLTGEQVGTAVERSGSWVSRVETGRVGLRGRDLTELLDLFEVADTDLRTELTALAREGKQRGWWSKYADSLSGPYATYIGFEAEATRLQVYETLTVHGLLQTEEYARALFRAGLPVLDTEAVDRRVKVRLARQNALLAPAPESGEPGRPLALWAIFDESVLHRRIGGEDVLRGQLAYLLQATELPNVTVQILPFTAGAHPGMVGSFTVIKFPADGDPDVVYVEGVTGDIFAESEDARWYNVVFEHLLANALSPSSSRERIARAIDELS